MNNIKRKYVFFMPLPNIPFCWASELKQLLQESRQITRQAFMNNCLPQDVARLEHRFGYFPHTDPGYNGYNYYMLPKRRMMQHDSDVTYHKGHLKGFWCYYFKHLGVPYLFVTDSVRWKFHTWLMQDVGTMHTEAAR